MSFFERGGTADKITGAFTTVMTVAGVGLVVFLVGATIFGRGK